MIPMKYIWPVFILMVLAQIALPLWSIRSSEVIIKEGASYKFKALPIDPFDPFRGKYVRLAFEVERPIYPIENVEPIQKGQSLYASISLDDEGFVKFDQIFTSPPSNGEAYVKVECNFTNEEGVFIQLKNKRFYMEESLAQPAEDLLRDGLSFETKTVYALINILNGESLLSEVMVDDLPLAQYVRTQLEKEPVPVKIEQ